MYLLDTNLLIALCDADHEHHALSRKWFRAEAQQGWATCPLTENGLLRIMGHACYPGGPGSPYAVRPLLQQLRSHPGHYFFPDAISFSDDYLFANLEQLAPKELTDIYLLALAVHNKARLASLDKGIDPRRVVDGPASFTCLLR